MKHFITFFLLIFLNIALVHAQEGSLDKSYGKGGIALTKPASSGGSAAASAMQPDDKVIIGAHYVDSSVKSIDYNRIFLVLQRYDKDGSLDKDFGNGGSALRLIDSPYTDNGDPGWKAVAVQPDGRILAATSLYQRDERIELPFNERGYATLARYNADGSPDSSFGTNGIAITDVNGQNSDIKAMALQKDGKIVLTGQITKDAYSNGPILLMRYHPDGTLDKTFGGTGYVAGLAGGYTNLSILVQPDGKILSGGYNLTSFLFSLFRYLPDGTPDPSFGNNGLVITRFPETIYTQINSLALLEDGRILAGGIAADEPYTDNMTVLRYLPDGTLDKTFGREGKAFVAFGSNDTTSTVIKLFVKPDGKILLAGSTLGGFLTGAVVGFDFVLAQLLPGGSVDSSFGTNGKTVTDVNGGADDVASGTVMQSDGNVVVTGTSLTHYSSSSYQYYYTLARYNTGGKAQRPIVVRIRRWLSNHGIAWNGIPGVSYYNIERSNGGAFREVDRMASSAGRQTYTYSVAASANTGASIAAATGSYRVTAVGTDGQRATSNLVSISGSDEPALSVYPNPATRILTISGLDGNGRYSFTVTDAGGTVQNVPVTRQQGAATCDVSSLRKGTYFIRLSNGTTNHTLAFIKE